MPKEEKELKQPTTEVKEDPESTIKRLTVDNENLRKLAEKAIGEAQILRAAIKAITQLL